MKSSYHSKYAKRLHSIEIGDWGYLFASLSLLETIGIVFSDDEALKAFKKGGALVGDGCFVRIGRKLVGEAIE